MWNVWYYLSSRLGHYSNSATRLCITDTDSIFQAAERQESLLEMTETTLLRSMNKEIPFETSLHAYRFATHIVQTYGRILDWSSIKPESFVYRTLTDTHENNENDADDMEALALKVQLEFLARKTKNRPFFLKNEAGDMPLKHCLASSPK